MKFSSWKLLLLDVARNAPGPEQNKSDCLTALANVSQNVRKPAKMLFSSATEIGRPLLLKASNKCSNHSISFIITAGTLQESSGQG